MGENYICSLFHNHFLYPKESSVREEKVDCYVCGKVIADLDMTYVCLECDRNSSGRFILHKKCGDLRYQIRILEDHTLQLHDFHLSRDDPKCDFCRGSLDNVVGYQCRCCEFRFHPACVDAFLKEKKELRHPSHPHHPLTLMRKPAFRFTCDGCKAQDVDMAYMCTTCDFWLHKACALLPARLPTDHHHHQLSLAFSFPEKHRKFLYRCDVCGMYMLHEYWLYYCGDCRCFVHIKCVGTMLKPPYNSIGDEGSDVIEFPVDATEVYNKLITPFVMREKGVDNIPIPSDHSFIFKYHDHPLRLVLKDDESESESETKICDACVTPISSPPYYQCTSHDLCTYFIHPICCFLPNTLHPNSQLYGGCLYPGDHKFTLHAPLKSKARDAISYWHCDHCFAYTNGMGYKCEKCGLMMDIKCASLPKSMRLASHPHNKLLHNAVDYGYYHCNDDDCNYKLHRRMAPLPKSITDLEWDKHALLLTSNASLDHPSDFYCEFCEVEMYPKQWMYHCHECDVSFHPECLKNASGCYRNVKLGGRFEMHGIHPNHSLTFTYITLKSRCDVCRRKNVYTFLGFECASCYFVACKECGGNELEKN